MALKSFSDGVPYTDDLRKLDEDELARARFRCQHVIQTGTSGSGRAPMTRAEPELWSYSRALLAFSSRSA